MAVRFSVEDGVGFLTLDRPERAHAYDRTHLGLLLSALDAVSTPVVVIQSTGERTFCGGADLEEMRAGPPLEALDLLSQHVFTRLARLPAVTIAAIQGAAVAGGFELALACDLRVVGPAARCSLPETSLGLIPSAGGTTRLARLVGVSRAKEVILGGRVLDADAALEWGVAHRKADDPRAEARAWASELLTRDAVAQVQAKRLLDADESASSLLAERVVEAGLYFRRRLPRE